jgi:hypothetical protein
MNAKIETVADSAILKMIGRGAQILAVPAFLWFGNTLLSIDHRLSNVETTLAIKAPDIYPRSEANQAFQTLNARINGQDTIILSNTHRIGALEERADRR